MNGREVYEFGPFRLDATGPLLLRGREPVSLTPKAAATLLALVRRAGHVVAKEELIKEVWPDTFVEEGNLSNNVWTVRKALEDDGADFRYVETLPKRGYRFVAQVRRLEAAPGPDEAQVGHETSHPPPTRWWTRSRATRRVGAVMVVGMVAGIAFAVFRARRPEAALRPAREQEMSIEDVTAGKTRVAVLPFENLTHQPDDDWMAYAFSDSVTFGLESLDTLVVVSRNGVAQAYRQHGLREVDRLEPDSIDRLARTLNIAYYVHGSYQRVGNQVRVGARLIEVESGAIRAQKRVTDRLANLLQLEDALAQTFATSLESGGRPVRRRSRTNSLAAHRALTEARGLYAASRWKAALEASKGAVDLDPLDAEGWALLGKSYARVAAPSNFVGGPLQEYRSLARAAANRAVDLDPSSYEAYVALALAHRELAQYEPWRAAARKAIALNPRFSEAYALLGDAYSETPAWGCPPDGNLPLAISSYRKALQIDPAVYTYYAHLSEDVLKASGPEAALRVTDETLRFHPTNRAATRARVLPLIELGRLDEAERMLREAIADRGLLVQDHRDLAMIELRRGRLEAAASGFEKALAARGHSWRPSIARQYIKAGVIPPAVDHLEETFRAEPACANWLLTTTSPYWAAIRANPAARAVLEKYRPR